MTFEDVNWMQNKTFSAREDRQLVAALVGTEGVFNGLVVGQRGAGANMSVDITAGRCAIQGDDQANQGMYVVTNISTDNVAIGAAPGSNSRIDLVCVRVNDPNATGPAGDNATYVVVAGTVAASPVPPALPTSAIPIAQVLVASGTAAITTAMITDVRVGARTSGDDPFGTIKMYAGVEAGVPADYVLCNGQAINRSTFFALFRVIGTTYGAGNGTTTFNVPDLRGRVVVGLDNMGGSDAGILTAANTLGGTGGAEAVAIDTTMMPAHTHTVVSHTHAIDHDHGSASTTSDGAHTHTSPAGGGTQYMITDGTTIGVAPPAGFLLRWPISGTYTDTASGGAHSHTFDMPAFTGASGAATPATNSTGGGLAHNNMQPYMLMNYIMRAA